MNFILFIHFFCIICNVLFFLLIESLSKLNEYTGIKNKYVKGYAFRENKKKLLNHTDIDNAFLLLCTA